MNTPERSQLSVGLVAVLGALVALGIVFGVRFYRRQRSLARDREAEAMRNERIEAQLSGLRSGQQSDIHFDWTSDTDDLLSHFRGMPEVEGVSLTHTDVTQEGLNAVRSLPNLRRLSILCGTYRDRPRVGDAALGRLRGHPKLERLELQNTNVTDAGLAVLATLPNLKRLTLYREGIRPAALTDRAFDHLQGLKQLKELWVSGGWMSAKTVAELRKALPDCRINQLPSKPPKDGKDDKEAAVSDSGAQRKPVTVP